MEDKVYIGGGSGNNGNDHYSFIASVIIIILLLFAALGCTETSTHTSLAGYILISDTTCALESDTIFLLPHHRLNHRTHFLKIGDTLK